MKKTKMTFHANNGLLEASLKKKQGSTTTNTLLKKRNGDII